MSHQVMSIDDDGARISPTAHYTAAVWARSGLSDPALSTWLGAILHAAFAPVNEIYDRLSGGTNLDAMLLARHRALDALLERAVVAGRVGQVIEIAAGLSGRGCRFARRFSDLHYIETDLPAMAAFKRRTLDEAGLRSANHDVRSLDALASDGPSSLAAVAATLDSTRGLAIVTEGLLSYLARDAVLKLWRCIVTTLGRFPHGLYLSDLHLAGDLRGMWGPELFRRGLGLFARGPVRHHFAAAHEAVEALSDVGFGDACLYYPDEVVSPDLPARGSARFVRVLAAGTRADGGHA